MADEFHMIVPHIAFNNAVATGHLRNSDIPFFDYVFTVTDSAGGHTDAFKWNGRSPRPTKLLFTVPRQGMT